MDKVADEVKVKVTLRAACLVDGAERAQGDIVELPEAIADVFGEREKADEEKPDAKAKKK